MRAFRDRILKYWPGRAFLGFLSLLYFLALTIRRFYYRLTAHKGKRLSGGAYVISVGNLTAGGTGKTSMTSYLSEKILNGGVGSVCVITRGYKGGDEARMLMREFGRHSDHFQMRIGADRFRLADSFLKERSGAPNPWVFILDDAHQHFSLAKDCSVVLINCLEPEELSALLPLGLLREPLSWGLRRADAVVLTYADLVQPSTIAFLKSRIDSIRPGVPIFRAAHEPFALARESQGQISEEALNILEGKPIVLVSGIGNPHAFEETVSRRLKVKIRRHFIFEDHYAYTDKDLEEIYKLAGDSSAVVLTTMKDLIRFPKENSGAPSVFALKVRLKILEAEAHFLRVLGIEDKTCAA